MKVKGGATLSTQKESSPKNGHDQGTMGCYKAGVLSERREEALRTAEVFPLKRSAPGGNRGFYSYLFSRWGKFDRLEKVSSTGKFNLEITRSEFRC